MIDLIAELRSVLSKFQQVLLLMNNACERGWISSGKYKARQSEVLRAWRRGGFRVFTTGWYVWSGELIYLRLSNHPLGVLVHGVSEVKFILWFAAPPMLLSRILYMDWQGSRSLASSRYEGLSEDMKNVWFLLGVLYLTVSMSLFLILFFWSFLPTA